MSCRTILVIINITQTVAAVALACVSIRFHIELKQLSILQNPDRNLLDYEAHWPELVPWLYFGVCVTVICVSTFGVFSACTRSAVFIYMTFQAIVMLVALAAGTVSLINDSTKQETEEYVRGVVSDAFEQIRFREDVKEAFGFLERKFRCCGAEGSVSYSHSAPPESCCDSDELVAKSCRSASTKRLGCGEVAVSFTRVYIEYASIGLLIIGVVCAIGLIVTALDVVRRRCNGSEDSRSVCSDSSVSEQEPLKATL